MKAVETKTSGRVIVAKIESDEDVLESISKLIKKYDLKSGIINVMGVLKRYALGYFDIHHKEYAMLERWEEVEVVSAAGNISWDGEKPIPHIHCVLGRKDFSSISGHLHKGCIVSATCEVLIRELDYKISKKTDENWNLKFFDLPDKI